MSGVQLEQRTVEVLESSLPACRRINEIGGELTAFAFALERGRLTAKAKKRRDALSGRDGSRDPAFADSACPATPESVTSLEVRFAFHVLASVLALSLSPGFVELLDDGAHLLVMGHTDHAEEGGGCTEHGCTPASHHCACCTSIAIATAPGAATVRRAERTTRAWAFEVEADGPAGVRMLLERPPTA